MIALSSEIKGRGEEAESWGQLMWGQGSQNKDRRKVRRDENRSDSKVTVGQKQKTDEKRAPKVVVLVVELHKTSAAAQHAGAKVLVQATDILPSVPEHNGSARARSEMKIHHGPNLSVTALPQEHAAGPTAPSCGSGGY